MKKALVIGVAVATLAGVAACSSSGNGTDGGSSGSGSSGGTGTPAKGVTIGFAVPVVANPYWQLEIQFAKQMASQLGVKLVVEDSNDQAGTQLQNVQNLVAKGVKGIVVAPINTDIGPAILKVCRQSHIVCTAAERSAGVQPSASTRSYFPGSVLGDDSDLGARTASSLAQAGAKKCVAMSGQVGNSVADKRLEGFQKYAKVNGISVLSTFRPAELAADGQQATENFLSKLPGPGFNCVFGFDGDVADGAVSALTKAGVLNKVKISAIGPTAANLTEIKAGRMLSSIGGEFMDGGFALIMAYDAINGHYATSGAVTLHGVTIKKNNVDKYAVQFGGSTVTGYDAKQLSATYNPSATTAGLKIALSR